MGITMSLDFELMKLIARGKNADARYDIIRLLDDRKCVTIAILDEVVELKDKAIRNFIADLQKIDYVELYKHKLPGGRWITLIVRKGSNFVIQEVIKAHLGTRKKKQLYRAQEIRFIEDIPFEFYITGYNVNYRNDHLQIHVILDIGLVSNVVAEAEKMVRQQLDRIRKKTPQLLQYLEK